MNIFPYNKTVEANIKQILKTLMLSMNGVSSDRMKEYGIIYKKNYGVSLPRIKEIAQIYQPDSQLASHLWAMKYRESMILATLLYPIHSFTQLQAEKWVNDACCSEICEQLVYNLIIKTDFAHSLALKCIHNTNLYIQICGLLNASRTCSQYTQSETDLIIEQSIKLSKTHSHELAHAISVSLRFFCRLNHETAIHIKSKICTFENTENKGQNYIYQEVMQEISFLYE